MRPSEDSPRTIRSRRSEVSEVLDATVEHYSKEEGVVGIAVFGSFVRGELKEESDLDLLIIRSDVQWFEKKEQTIQDMRLELNVWPKGEFEKTFTPEGTNLGQDGFALDVMRTCVILYDPFGALLKWKEYAKTHSIPQKRLEPVLNRIHGRLGLARELLDTGQLEGSELEIRLASEDLVRVFLIRRDVMLFTIPRHYLRSLRVESADLYGFFRELHRLGGVARDEAQKAIDLVSEWQDRCRREIHERGRQDWLAGATRGAFTEIQNARDCLRSGDVEAAMMQARYSAILVTSPIELLARGAKTERLSERITRLGEMRHPYMDVFRRIMNFREDRDELTQLIPEMESRLPESLGTAPHEDSRTTL